MTAKKRATQIFNKMLPDVIDDSDKNEVAWWNAYAKWRAIICVDEIIYEFNNVGITLTNEDGKTPIEYWLEVKTELEKL